MSDLRDADDLSRDPQEEKPAEGDRFLPPRQYNSDSKQQRKQKVKQKAQDLREENDLRAVLATEEGLRVIARIMGRCGWNAPHFHPSNSVMCEIAGRRSIAWQIEQWVSDTDLNLWFALRSLLEETRKPPET